jgi:hypothetical protein
VVEVSGDDNIVPLVTATVNGGVLHLDTTESIRPNLKLVVRVVSPKIESIDVSGAADVLASGFEGERLRVDLSGAAGIEIDGKVGELEVSLSGAGRVNARKLVTQKAKVDVSGAGKVEVNATDSLDATISGAGTISKL